MAQNQIAHATNLEDFLFTKEEILRSVENHEHIFEMKEKSGPSIGYISLYDLKAYSAQETEAAKNYMVRNVEAENWTLVFEHPILQRRKPQIVTNISVTDDQQFYILQHGQKIGPYEKSNLISMFDDKKILLTNMISSDGGRTWMKLYHVDGFERRDLRDQLPGMPSEFLLNSNEKVSKVVSDTEAISGLAYLSNVKRGKIIEREKNQFYENDAVSKTGMNSLYKWIFLISAIGVVYFLFTIKTQLLSPFKAAAPEMGEQQQAEVLSPINTAPTMDHSSQVNDQRRTAGKFETRVMQPIRPHNRRKSFMETPGFREIATSPAAEPGSNDTYETTQSTDTPPAESEGPIPSSDNLFESEISN